MNIRYIIFNFCAMVKVWKTLKKRRKDIGYIRGHKFYCYMLAGQCEKCFERDGRCHFGETQNGK